MAGLLLEPEHGVAASSHGFIAETLPAWLAIPNFIDVCGHNWFYVRYASSFFDRPTRPLLRFITRSGREYIYVLNGAVLGTAEWVGRVPDNTVSTSICVTDRLGPFDFRFDEARAISKYSLASRNIATGVSRSRRLVTNRLADARQFEVDLYKIANAATPVTKYAQWARRFRRTPDLYGLDRPRTDWATGPVFAFVMAIDATTRPRVLETTIKSLQEQRYRRWALIVCVRENASERAIRAYKNLAAQDRRLGEIGFNPSLSNCDTEWFAAISPGDTLDHLALGVCAEEAARDPAARLIYCDEDAVGEKGRIHSPRLKPDWSPTFQAASHYIGRLTVLRKDALNVSGLSDPRLIATEEEQTLRDITKRLSQRDVSHIQRILYHRQGSSSQRKPLANTPEPTTAWPEASIVIVTRDRADLLRECLRGIRELTDYPNFNAVIVDNGTTEKSARDLLASLEADERFHIIRRPGPFNYSALCNEGARQTRSPLLVFMNNDVEMRERNWLRNLAREAIRPDVGIAGAKLLFPSGRIQHTGVTLGLGMVAGHLNSNVPGDDNGYLNQLIATREVCAVTAACCAIERAKFESLGGFDEVNLPVEFSDIDLCLRAMERGWLNLCVADSVLIHRESETRGVALAKVYEAERNYFVHRWSHIIRDDPYFHPGLSMFALRPSLA